MKPFACLIPLLLSGPLLAEPQAACPAPPDHADRLSSLLAEAREAGSAREAQPLTNAMWHLWAKAPDARAQAMLDRGMTRRAGFDLLGAREDFDALVAYCPGYAEGWNQRGFVHFIAQDYAAALGDLDRAVALAPDHVAARAGRALTLLALGRPRAARAELAAALARHPWLPEARVMPQIESMIEASDAEAAGEEEI